MRPAPPWKPSPSAGLPAPLDLVPTSFRWWATPMTPLSWPLRPEAKSRCSLPGLQHSDLGRTIRRCPLASTAVGDDCYSIGYSVARESVSRAAAKEIVRSQPATGHVQLSDQTCPWMTALPLPYSPDRQARGTVCRMADRPDTSMPTVGTCNVRYDSARLLGCSVMGKAAVVHPGSCTPLRYRTEPPCHEYAFMPPVDRPAGRVPAECPAPAVPGGRMAGHWSTWRSGSTRS